MDLYAACDLGARSVEISFAMAGCSHCKAGGSLMMSGSANKLYRNGCTSSGLSGPPRLRRMTPTLAVDAGLWRPV